MKPLIGFSVLLVILVCSINIIKSGHSISYNEPTTKVKRYLQQNENIGMPTVPGDQAPSPQIQEGLTGSEQEAPPADGQPIRGPVNDPGQVYDGQAQAEVPAEIPQQPESIQPQGVPETPGSAGRGLTNIMLAAAADPNQQQMQHQQQQIQQQKMQQQQQPEEQPPPRIIENNRESVPPKPQEMMPAPGQPGHPATQEMSPVMANQTFLASTARSYGLDGWTRCSGTDSGKSGVCKNDIDCKNAKGRSEGSCMGGLGVCCVIALSCGDKSSENNTFFANPDFPDGTWDARLCEVEIKKKSTSISQILIEFEDFELALPDYEGECVTDIFQVKLASNRYSPYSNIRLCGMNTGQHLYLDVSQMDDPVVLSVATSGAGYSRRWSIKIIQMDDKNYLQAPPGCLQYYTDTTGIIRSFNLGKNLRNLYYAICFRIDNGYSGIRFTDNFFGMSGGECTAHPKPLGYRKKIGTHIPGYHVPHNGPYQPPPPPYSVPPHPRGYSGVYNPHHLVIAPPGHVHQLTPPGYANYAPAGPRYKRQSSANYTALSFRDRRQVSLDVNGQPVKREHFWNSKPQEKEENKEFKGEKEFKGHEEYYPTTGYLTSGYPISYTNPQEYPGHSKFVHEGKNHGPHHQGYYGPAPGGSPYGGQYGAAPYPAAPYGPSPPGRSYGPPAYGPPTYGPPGYGGGEAGLGYTPHRSAGHYGGYSKHKPGSYGAGGYGHGGYGPSGYGPGGYGPGGYGGRPYSWPNGGAYHKEIDKFGKKYEEIYYQNEKNHKKGDKKDDRWWDRVGKKNDKKDKKEKDRHHEVDFPELELFEPPHCEPRSCSSSDVITFPPSTGATAEMCGNQFNRGRGSIVVSGSPLVVYVNSRGRSRGFGFDLYYEQVFALPHHHY